jgi:tetratricopeptide (TPR) repeat protein
VINECRQVLSLDRNSGAAYYLMGCAYLQSNQPEKAVQAFEQSKRIDPAVTALNFQLGLAQERLGHLEDAVQEFETIVRFEPIHPSAHYQLSRLYQKLGRETEAAKEMQRNQRILAEHPAAPRNERALMRCKYTEPRLPMKLAQPDRRGIPVRFVEATATAFGSRAAAYHGPIAVMDYNHDGRNSLFAMEGEKGFRLLSNNQGRFEPVGEILPAKQGSIYRRCLLGDVNNDGFEDVIVLGEQASHAFRFATNGKAREVTAAAGLGQLQARDGLLADLDFTGNSIY